MYCVNPAFVKFEKQVSGVNTNDFCPSQRVSQVLRPYREKRYVCASVLLLSQGFLL